MKMKLKNYISLSKSIQKPEDIVIKKLSLLDVYECVSCDYDKINGRGISVSFNNTKIEWFEQCDKVIACAVLMENENHKNIILNKILQCLSDKLFMCNKFGVDVWDDIGFKEAHKHFENLMNLKQKQY